MNETDYVVSVICATYNHENYVKDTIEGFLMQKTSFPIEIIIHDDASTDNTAEIVKSYAIKYPDLIFPIFQSENQYSKKISIFHNYVSPRIRGKYVAWCEGDDYWTDAYKLQKQVDFLEDNSDYSLVCSDYDTLNITTGEQGKNHLLANFNLKEQVNITFENYVFKRIYIRTLTVMIRRKILDEYYLKVPSDIVYNGAAGDLPIWFYILSKSKAIYIPESTATYRISPGTASRPIDFDKQFDFKENVNAVVEYFLHFNNLPRKYFDELSIRKYIYRMEYNAKKGKRLIVFLQFLKLIFIKGHRKEALSLLLSCMK